MWRIVKKLGRARKRVPDLDPTVDPEIPIAPGSAGFVFWIIDIPQDFRTSRELKSSSIFKVRDDQASTRIDCEVAERVEHAIARVIGDSESSRVEDLDESRIATAMGRVDAAGRVLTGHEQCVCARNPLLLIVIQFSPIIANWSWVVVRVGRRPIDAALDVLGAVGIRLLDNDVQQVGSWGLHAPVHA